jgi:P4 family phage/plasmid primase-like protien
MNQTVDQLLRKHYVDTPFNTHVSLIQPKGKFQFNRQGMEEFWTSYCDMIDTSKNPVVGVAERPQKFLSVMADIDLKMKEEENSNYDDGLYTEYHAKQVIQVYQGVLQHIIEGCSAKHLTCILLEKPLYKETKGDSTYVKNGFHIHFPYLFLSKIDQEVHLIPRVQKEIETLETFLDVGIGDSSQVVDKQCCKVHWMMYGSRKSEEMKPYLLTKCFDAITDEITLEKAFEQYQLFDTSDQSIDIKGKIKYYLPRILSIVPCQRQTQEIKHGLASPLKEKLKTQKPTEKQSRLSVVDALKTSSRLLPMLDSQRAVDRSEWMTIGWALFNIGEGSPEAMDQWLEFSERAGEDYDEASCIYQWSKMVKKDVTLGTIKYYANKDNPEKYKEFRNEQAEHYIRESLTGSHNDVAKVLYADYGNEFVCSSIGNKTWYQFREHTWKEIEDGIFLRQKISGELAVRYGSLGSNFFDRLTGSDDKIDDSLYNLRIQQSQKLVAKLKEAPYKSNVMRECQEVFYDDRFTDKLDTNTHTIAFKNGVYDLKENHFRAGRPEDFISKAMPIEYINYSEGDEHVSEVYDFLEKVFPDKSVRRFFMDVYSDIFVGGNARKIVVFWTGVGDNGKSITQLLFEKMLGQLSVKFETTLMSGKKTQSGCAAPELARAGPPIRHATLEEPDSNEQLNTGYMKKLSGGDSFWARDLFQSGKATKEIIPMFMLTFICNGLPELRNPDKATWNRIKVIPFETTFVRPGEPCPESYEEQLRQKKFPMDQHFSAKIPNLVNAFAWVLLEHRKKPMTNFEPEKVRQATLHYQQMNDIYRQFIQERIIEDLDNKLSQSELISTYRGWFKECFPGRTIPDKNVVTDYFNSLWGDPKRSMWHGYKIRNIDDEDDEEENDESDESDESITSEC